MNILIPGDWNKDIVTAIHIYKDANKKCYYRSICVTPVVCKLTELNWEIDK